jgi:hypothetical protein
MKYLIQLEDNKFVEQFSKNSIAVTNNIKMAGKYTKSIANKRLLNFNIIGALIPIN